MAVGGTPGRYTLRRSPTSPTITRGSRQNLVEKIFLGDYEYLFSELCGTWSPSNTQKVWCNPLLLNSSNDSLVSHKEKWAIHWEKINKILVYRFLGTLFLKAKWSSNTCPTSWERRNLCLHYKMLCTIGETTSLSNLFQPLDLRQNGLAIVTI